MKISVIIPVYNCENTLRPLISTLIKVLGKYQLEIVLVNDGSKDRSELICAELAKELSFIKFISLRKNRGEHNAVICGLNYCTGDYAAIIDDDFQNPPSEIISLLNKAIQYNYDVVYAKYEQKHHSFFRNLGSALNDWTTRYLIEKPKGLYLCSFKLIKKELVNEIIAYKGPFPYIDALILRCTDNIGTQTVKHADRKEGKSNYTLRKLISLYLNIFINFSYKPLRVVTFSGIIISFFSVLFAIFVLYEKLFLKNVSPGWAFLSLLLLFSIGVTFFVIGLLGEYIGKILMALNNTPQYTIKKQVNTETYTKSITKEQYDRETI
ncbi:MAG: glycosyltransferase [Pedobacter sp.]|nr:MAG: glycosyltransferase [Pedobacter sp.]